MGLLPTVLVVSGTSFFFVIPWSLVLSRKLLVCGADDRSGLQALWGSEACDLENVLLWPQGGALAPLKRPGWWGRGRGAEGGGAVVRKGAGLLPSIVVISRVHHL